MNNVTPADPYDPGTTPPESNYSIGVQVCVSGVLLLEVVLGLGSNLTVLILYCTKNDLVSSVSSIFTINLHVVDVLVCVSCVPLTAVMVLLPLVADVPAVSCLHEACVSFAGLATAANVLAITVDRYDISVHPVQRVLTPRRAVGLLGCIWALSSCGFLVPFMELNFIGSGRPNRTEVAEANGAPGLYYHLLAQIPVFFCTAAVMLLTYYKILQALNVRIGTKGAKQEPKSPNAVSPSAATQAETADASTSGAGPKLGGNGALGMSASVSVIVALRRAVKRHRDRRERRERQRRLVRTSLLIVSSFLLCWTPMTLLNILLLISAGAGRRTARLRAVFLAMAYGTTVFHPLLYAFTRKKFQKVLKSKMKKRCDPPPAISVSFRDPRHKRLHSQD